MTPQRIRCPWGEASGLERAYHDHEWGVPLHDDTRLFEFLILEGAQAGLSWSTILAKREGYREAFEGFAMDKVARFSETRITRLLKNPRIVRNRLKVRSAVNNAQAALAVIEAFSSLDAYLWGFVDGEPIVNGYRTMTEMPAQTPLAETISKDLKQRGFRFVGPVIVYAYMQSIGLVNDHVVGCFRHPTNAR